MFSAWEARSVLPLAICKFWIDALLMSSVTVLVLSTMHTSVVELFGAPDGVQFDPVPQFPLLPRDQTEGVPLNEHGSADAGAAPPAMSSAASASGETETSPKRAIRREQQ